MKTTKTSFKNAAPYFRGNNRKYVQLLKRSRNLRKDRFLSGEYDTQFRLSGKELNAKDSITDENLNFPVIRNANPEEYYQGDGDEPLPAGKYDGYVVNPPTFNTLQEFYDPAPYTLASKTLRETENENAEYPSSTFDPSNTFELPPNQIILYHQYPVPQHAPQRWGIVDAYKSYQPLTVNGSRSQNERRGLNDWLFAYPTLKNKNPLKNGPVFQSVKGANVALPNLSRVRLEYPLTKTWKVAIAPSKAIRDKGQNVPEDFYKNYPNDVMLPPYSETYLQGFNF